MALEYGFFNAAENSGTYDREVGQVFFTELLKAVFKTGISPNSFIASAGTGLTVNLTSGRGAIDGVFFCDTSASTVTLTAATGTRTDLIVVRLNTASRNVEIAVKQGTTATDSNEVAIATVIITGSTIISISNSTRINIINADVDYKPTSSDDTSSNNDEPSQPINPSSGSSSDASTKSGTLVSKITSTASSPSVHYSAAYSATKNGTALSVNLSFAAWLNSSGSMLGTGIKLTIYARLNGGSWKSVVTKENSASWKGTSHHPASLKLTATTNSNTATVEFYVTRTGSNYSGTAGTLGSQSAPKKYTFSMN